jgi:hypothetical protein
MEKNMPSGNTYRTEVTWREDWELIEVHLT